MSLTNWFVNKYLRAPVQPKPPVVKELNCTLIKYKKDTRYCTESSLYIDHNFIMKHGPYHCTSHIRQYLILKYEIILTDKQEIELRQKLINSDSGHIKLSGDRILKVDVHASF